MISSAAQVPLKAETTLDIADEELQFKIFSQNTVSQRAVNYYMELESERYR